MCDQPTQPLIGASGTPINNRRAARGSPAPAILLSGALMRPRSLSIGLLALVAMATPGAAREVLLHNRFVTCVAASPNVVRLWVDGVGFDVATDHSSAHAVVHLQLRSNAEVAYAVSGRADLIKKDLAPNTGGRVIAYA